MKEKQAEQEAAEAKAAEQETAETAEAEKAEDAKNAEEAAEPEVDPKDAKIEELQNRLLRLQADFENFRRRTNIEKEQLSTFVTANVVGKFLKVLDNFERAEASVEKGDNVDAVVDGMKKIRRQFEDAFKDLKVEEIEAQNAKFDPNIHEAVMRGHNPELDDEIVEDDFLFGAVSNSTSVGGVLSLDPKQVDLRDGKFEVLLLRSPRELGELSECIRAVQTAEYNCKMLTFTPASRVTVWANAGMPWTLDGEMEPGHEEVTIENIHCGLKVMCKPC